MVRSFLQVLAVTLLFFLVHCTCVRAQTVIGIMDFDGTTPEVPFSGDVTFFDDGADGFFGIHNANGDDTDGTPMDTGTGNGADIAAITFANITGDFFFINDLNNSDSGNTGDDVGTAGEATLQAGPFNVGGQTGIEVTFDYQIVGFDAGDEFGYEIFVDNESQGLVDLKDGMPNPVSAQGTARYCVPDGASTIVVAIRVTQNGDSDQAAFDNITVTAGTGCTPSCNLNVDPADLRLFCTDFTDNPDAVTASIRYFGRAPGVTVSVDNGATIAADSDDPATEEGGTNNDARSIRLEGLTEGQSYTLTISGGACTGTEEIVIPINVAGDLCQQSDLVINEFLADPGSVNDANNDMVFSGSEDEFVELYNASTTDAIDVSGFTVEENSGVFFVFPGGSTILPENGFVIFGGGTPDVSCNNSVANVRNFIGLNNDGDQIIVRDAAGSIVAQVFYGTFSANGDPAAPNDESLALNPDGNLAGGYVPHTSIPNPLGDPLTNSACRENEQPQFSLPVELTYLGAHAGAKSVEVRWTTASESGNRHFVVERSADGTTFAGIGRVAAATGRSAENHYSLVDERPLPGTSFYRLRQVDLDGTETFFGPVSVTMESAVLAVYPNPVRETLTVAGPLAATDRLTLLSAEGRMLSTQRGSNRELTMGTLPTGLYFLRVESAGGVEVLRVVKE